MTVTVGLLVVVAALLLADTILSHRLLRRMEEANRQTRDLLNAMGYRPEPETEKERR